MTNSQYNKLYQVYVDRYKKAEKAARAKNLPIDKKLEMKDFKSHFNIHKNTMVEDGNADPKPVQVVKHMIDWQRYGTSTEAQGRAVYMAVADWEKKKRENTNKEREAKGLPPIEFPTDIHTVDIETIRSFYEYMSAENEDDFNELPAYQRKQGAIQKEFFDEIRAEYKMLRSQGLDGKKAKALIAQQYFGSP